MDFYVREASFEEVNGIHKKIPEFDEGGLRKKYRDRCPETDLTLLAAENSDILVAYAISYDKFGDDSYYIWMAGVIPKYRREGIMTKIIRKIESIAEEKGYKSVRIKTRNGRKEMRHLLISEGYEVIGFNEKETLKRSEIPHIKYL